MAKQIIDIEVREGEWTAFQRQVDAYRKKLADTPHQWGAIGKAMVRTAGQGAKIVAKMTEMTRALENAKTLSGKVNLALKAADRTVTALGRGAATFGRHIKDATKSLVSWLPIMGIMSGLLGAGGLFGLSRLAASVSQGMIGAMGAGTSYGGAKAAGISYGPAMGEGAVTSILNRIAEEQRSGGVMFRRLGMSEEQWKGRDSSDVLGPMLAAIQRKYKEGPEGTAKQRMEAFMPGMDFNTVLRISKLNIDGLEKEYQARKHLLDLSQGTQDSWARFHRALETAGERLEAIFARALGGNLLTAIERFTNGLLRATSTLMNSPLIRNLIAGAGKGIESGAKYLASKEFQTDLKEFLSKMNDVVDALSVIADALINATGQKDKRFQKDLERETAQIQQFWQRKEFERNATKTIQMQHPNWTPGRVHAEVEVLVQNASGGNMTAQAVGVRSSTYRR